MTAIRQVFSVAGYNFRQWHKNPRVFLTFALAFILCFLLSDKVIRFAQENHCVLQAVEPFIWTFGDSDSILFSSLLLVFLFADMPFLTGGTPFYLIRTSRRVWLLGQAVYIALSTLLYLAFVLASTGVLCMKNAFPGDLWSETAARLGYSNAGAALFIPAIVKTMEMTTPYPCAAAIFLLILLYALLMAFFMLVFNLYKGQMAGMLAVFGFSLYGFLLSPDTIKTVWNLSEEEFYKANVVVGWLSPLNQATYSMHNFGYDYLPALWQTYGIFCLLILICFAAAAFLMRDYGFSFVGTEGGE